MGALDSKSVRFFNRKNKEANKRLRKQEREAREAARQKERKRIDGLRLKGTALNDEARRVNAAVGKEAIEKQRKRLKDEKRAAEKAAYDAAQKLIAEEERKEREAIKEAKKADAKAHDPLIPQDGEERFGGGKAGDFQEGLAAGHLASAQAVLPAFNAFAEGFEFVDVEAARGFIINAIDGAEAVFSCWHPWRKRK